MFIIVASSPCSNLTKEMLEWFNQRTANHIKLVQKYCKKIEEYDPKRFEGLVERGKDHDQSKYKAPEHDPYVYITWRYKCKDDGKKLELTKAQEDAMNAASEHHIKNNPHHPEYHTDQEGELVNPKDRDKPPDKLIDATKMGKMDIAELCADWCAMSEERDGSPKAWADKNVNVRWKFTDAQKDLIYELIEEVF